MSTTIEHAPVGAQGDEATAWILVERKASPAARSVMREAGIEVTTFRGRKESR